MTPRIVLALAVLGATGCVENDIAIGDSDDLAPDGAFEGTLAYRLDVLPPASAGDLLPASFVVQPDVTAHLVVRPPVSVTGCVSGYVLAPRNADAQVPGTDQALDATVRLGLDNSVQSALTATDEVGCFDTRVVPSVGYDLSVVSSEASVPFLVEAIDIDGDVVLDIDLGTGVPVWGEVTDGHGIGLPGAEVWAEDGFGHRGASAITDLAGRYLLHVDPGTYAIVSDGRNNGRDPRIRTRLLYVDDDGANVDLAYGTLETRAVGGRVTAPGVDVAGTIARFTAGSLEDYEDDVVMVVEATANGLGNYDTRLVPGTWYVELIPPSGRPVSPVDLGRITVDAELDLGSATLPALLTVDGFVVDPDGSPVVGALVECTEIGFGGRVWRGSSNDAGIARFDVARVPVRCAVTPPAARDDLAVTAVASAAEGVDADQAASLPDTWVLTPGAELTGAVVLFADGAEVPLEDTLVEIRDTKGRFLGTTLTNSRDGSFAVRVGWLE